MKEAIEMAYKFGWRHQNTRGGEFILEQEGMIWAISNYHPFFDPLFWQALGRALNWPNTDVHECPDCKTIGLGRGNHMQSCEIKDRKYSYNIYWHRFMDHLNAGHGHESFFIELLK